MTRNAQRPSEDPRRRPGSFGLMTLAPLAALALVVAVGVIWLGGREATVGGPSPSPAASIVTGAASPSAPSAPPSPSPTLAPTPSPSVGCSLSARIVSWEGAAGSRIATVELKNDGPEPCTVPAAARPALIDGSGRALALGVAPGGEPGTIELESGATAKALVRTSNICLAAPPAAPVTVLLDFGDGTSVAAQPFAPDDAEVAPCNGPTQPSEIDMQPWTR